MGKAKVYRCRSIDELHYEFELLRPKICLAESEDTWNTIADALAAVLSLCNNGASDYPSELIAVIRPTVHHICEAMKSERTRLSGIAMDLVAAIALGLGSSFEPLLSLFFLTLLNICGRPNKVVLARARNCITTIIENTQLSNVISFLVNSVKDKSIAIRLVTAEATLTCMNCLNPPDLEKETRAKDIESLIRATARDANADIRKVSRKIFEAYKILLPDRVDNFTAPLSPTMKKYLDIKKIVVPPTQGSSKTQAALAAASKTSSASDHVSSQPPISRSKTVIGLTAPHAEPERRTRHVSSKSASAAMPPPATIPQRQPERPPSRKAVVEEAKAPTILSRSTSALADRQRTMSGASHRSQPGRVPAPDRPPTRPISVASVRDLHRGQPHATFNLQGVTMSGPKRIPASEKAESVEKPLDSHKHSQSSKVVPSRVDASKSSGPQKFSGPQKLQPGKEPSEKKVAAKKEFAAPIKKEVPALVKKVPPPNAAPTKFKSQTSGINPSVKSATSSIPPAVRESKKPHATVADNVTSRTRSHERSGAAAKRPAGTQKVATKELPFRIPLPPSPPLRKKSVQKTAAAQKVPPNELPLQIPLPPSPSSGVKSVQIPQVSETMTAQAIPLPPSRTPTPVIHFPDNEIEISKEVEEEASETPLIQVTESDTPCPFTPRSKVPFQPSSTAKTPISALLYSIEHGFDISCADFSDTTIVMDQPLHLTTPFPLHTRKLSNLDEDIEERIRPALDDLINFD